ncbi:hypothetical protein [Phaeobacter sp. 22II1-1F12B]|uniref:hypothetical protein n=1 Tax=Phaeobacter sp. 22II1-1F12B TaxID=1317111 RepID=UPI001E322812|nr:hypothetical protein [Phaeobacter sp. 22II1-1F12B]
MTIAQGILVVVGLLSGLVLIGALLWSIVRPSKRIWPPNREHSVSTLWSKPTDFQSVALQRERIVL